MSVPITESAVRAVLQSVADPLWGEGQDLVSTQAIKAVRVEGKPGHQQVHVDMALAYPAQSKHAVLRARVCDAVRAALGADVPVHVSIATAIVPHAVRQGVSLLDGVKNIVAVASGKGGVGKSTVTANLALALAREGANVGILDADIYGPSQPMMMGLSGQPESPDGRTMEPMRNHGVQVMSIGFLIEADQAMIWRGPMATQALDQLLRQTRWQGLDYLLVDMPPGTGDIQLTLSQRVPLTGAVIVTTPQDIALIDAKKGLRMFEKVGVPILGVIENMALYCCPQCGHTAPIFGAGGAQTMAQQYGVEHLGSLPLSLSIRVQADSGQPSVAAEPDGEIARLYTDIAHRVAVNIAHSAKDQTSKFPTIKISKAT